MKPYKVIWIDDEYDTHEAFLDIANEEGVEIYPFKIAREGIEFFEKKKHLINGLILDAKTFADSEDEVPTQKGLNRALTSIARIDDTAVRVVRTGQADLMTNEEFEEALDGIPKFNKTESAKKFFGDFKALMDERSDRVIQMENQHLYEACSGSFLEGEDWGRFCEILKYIRFRDEIVYADQFNALRKIVESFFKKLNASGFLPDEFVVPQVNLKSCGLLLAGANVYMGLEGVVESVKPLLPKVLGSQLGVVLELLNTGSHTDDLPGTRMLESAFLMLSDIIPWAASYCADNPDAWENRKTWKKKASASSGEVRGIVKLQANGKGAWLHSHCGDSTCNTFLQKTFVDTNRISDGDEITVEFRTSRTAANFIATH